METQLKLRDFGFPKTMVKVKKNTKFNIDKVVEKEFEPIGEGSYDQI